VYRGGMSEQPVAIVTGAGSGIGLATVRRLDAEGWRVVLVGRGIDRLESAAALCRDSLPVVGDVSEPQHGVEVVGRALDHYGRLDAVVNNAGEAQLLPIDRHTPEVIESAFRTNAVGPACMIAAAWSAFVAQGSGCVVNLSSYATRDPFNGFFAYAASKAAVELMAKSCAKEGAAHGIRAYAVAPSAVETPLLRELFDESAIPASACLLPDAVARVIVECVLGKRTEENGSTIYLTGP